MTIKLIHKTIAFIVVMNLTKSERAAQKKRKDPGFHGEEMNDAMECSPRYASIVRELWIS